jgi:NADPH-dependent 2,4-dienoyl-CoA reductase/sulfur reductase-like enzyme
VLEALSSLGLSSICNVLGAIKTAKYFGYGPDDVVVTVATDGAAMYASERALALAEYFPHGMDEVAAGEVFGEHILGATTDHLLEPTLTERQRIFNLGYFTWVEQQGVSVDDFSVRKEPSFWTAMREIILVWDGVTEDSNARTAVLDQL